MAILNILTKIVYAVEFLVRVTSAELVDVLEIRNTLVEVPISNKTHILVSKSSSCKLFTAISANVDLLRISYTFAENLLIAYKT